MDTITLRFISAASLALACAAASPACAESGATSALSGGWGSAYADSFGLYGQGLLSPAKPLATDGGARPKALGRGKERNPAAPPGKPLSSGNDRTVKSI